MIRYDLAETWWLSGKTTEKITPPPQGLNHGTGYRLKSSLLQVTPFEKTLFVARILGYLQIQPSFSTYKLGLTSGKALLRPIAIAMF